MISERVAADGPSEGRGTTRTATALRRALEKPLPEVAIGGLLVRTLPERRAYEIRCRSTSHELGTELPRLSNGAGLGAPDRWIVDERHVLELRLLLWSHVVSPLTRGTYTTRTLLLFGLSIMGLSAWSSTRPEVGDLTGVSIALVLLVAVPSILWRLGVREMRDRRSWAALFHEGEVFESIPTRQETMLILRHEQLHRGPT